MILGPSIANLLGKHEKEFVNAYKGSFLHLIFRPHEKSRKGDDFFEE